MPDSAPARAPWLPIGPQVLCANYHGDNGLSLGQFTGALENGEGCHFVLGASNGMAYLEILLKSNKHDHVKSLI